MNADDLRALFCRFQGQRNGATLFCQPIGHVQERGDYQYSWQPQAMSAAHLKAAQDMSEKVTANLGGVGLFGVEFFVTRDEVIFSELSPRPHDTGMVTLISQDLSEFALHVRAILGLPIPSIRLHGASASCAVLIDADTANLSFTQVESALQEPDTALRLFGKPEVRGHRRMGVTLARADSVERARDVARDMAERLVAGARP